MIKDIEQKRKQLIETANRFGIHASITLECSKELDILIAHYQKSQYLKTTQMMYRNIS
ncbi:hypothetical protein JOD43_000207 [Pullulanibacillus pueri]|uniref:Aspartyl-phosphate phosphatase Spo0E family protein n=1 Tax=Pullulanibacillus pueri TaxID=1437324 RepID=A0A8J2ZSM5_9BACL|nr:aspartyl-phosphate phosphatase Spo0E family protein [Pullulanibacillus pueri]MBM7680048.1 hypothetical protein [Pullulanibacillus pueri]GGH74105.1 hypothetical protein GCM10007096_02000 [Pullulanibacillus pueri]